MLLDIKSLRVFYGRVEAVHGVDFHVDTGEVVTIIGNNGAGKSSILRAISGVVKGVTGTIRFNGQLINEMNPASIVKLGISQTPEGRQVFPDSTVYENLVGGAYIRKDKQKIKEDIERCYELFPILKSRRNQKAGLMLAVLAPAAGACSLIYLCIDSCSVRVIEDTKLIDLSELIAEEFYLSPINLLPAVILFAMISLKKSTLLCMLASIITGAVVSIVPQGKSLYAIADILFYGYGGYIRSSEDVINIIFARGGVSSVMGMTITLIIGMSLSGIANHLGLIKRVVNSLTNHVKTSRDAVALSLLFSIVGYGATGDSQPSKVIVGNAFSDIYERYNLERSVLSCSLEMTSFGEVLFPWTAGAVYYFSVFEIPVNRYWYFDFFCFFAILFQIVMGGKQKNIF